VNNDLFIRAIQNLYKAGYKPGDIECYLILGLPKQTPDDVRDSLDFVSDLGVIARLAVFSPIPGTPEAEAARKIIGDGFLHEPLLQNHSVFPMKDKSLTADELQAIKLECKRNNDLIRRHGSTEFAENTERII
jgi:coproporphyrinogen III oxidase-like Fe-S oxidoreductase